MKTRVLTGITTTGTPHLGNYVGAIRPAIRASLDPNVQAFFFLADFHALIKCEDPQRIARSRTEIAATWLAAGLDPEKVVFYRQSDILEIPELCWLLTCVTAKGLMNRAHAYKASVESNQAKGLEDDDGINMGLFSYPILMAADILMFNAHKVPVGRDQIQHLEMARDIGQRFNHLYPSQPPWFDLPAAAIDESVATLTGLDGRKMSKSYHNTIPLFEGGPKALKAAVAKIVTDSRAPGEPKDAQQSNLLPIFQAFVSPEQTAVFVDELAQGLGWGEAKQRLLAAIEADVAPMRETYDQLMAKPDDVEDILQMGAKRAREIAVPFMAKLRHAVGIGAVSTGTGTSTTAGSTSEKRKGKAAKGPRLVQFRDEGGQFRFKLLSTHGQTLCTSVAFTDPKQVGVILRQLEVRHDDVAVKAEGESTYVLMIDDQTVAHGPTVEPVAQRESMLAETIHALKELAV
jgi:tryptophanyl-tRNA synthetase